MGTRRRRRKRTFEVEHDAVRIAQDEAANTVGRPREHDDERLAPAAIRELNLVDSELRLERVVRVLERGRLRERGMRVAADRWLRRKIAQEAARGNRGRSRIRFRR